MPRRNDTFLSLCLAQAELLPLHYRHGSVIARGGKVIGQGFNSYRPGFDGGALKTGIVPSSTLDGPAIAELKQHLKSKPKHKPQLGFQNQQDAGSFMPFEMTGSGHNTNKPLSMHSEMMAITSALSLSSGTLSSQTSARVKNEKPAQEPLKRTLRQSAGRLRHQALTNPTLASSLFKSRVLNPIHLNQVKEEYNNKTNGKEEENEFLVEEKKDNSFYRSTQHKHYQHERGSEPQLSKNSVNNSVNTIRKISSGSSDDIISLRKFKTKQPNKAAPIPQNILITKSKATIKPDIAARTKDLRLKGSDLYVARLGSCNITLPTPSRARSTTPPLPTPSQKSEPSSLCDELSPLSRPNSTSSATVDKPKTLTPEIRASRPCYRCVSAMYAVGIKRVFWTNKHGVWESAKVRDLVEALEIGVGGDDGEGLGTGQESKGVFVTKHEVLMLKRMMDSRS